MPRLAIVTGGASGIGFGLATRAAQDGMIPVLLDWNKEALSAAAQRLTSERNVSVSTFHCDVSRREDMLRVADLVKQKYPSHTIGLLCPNAGVIGKMLLDSSEQEFAHQVGINLCGVLWTIQAFLPTIEEQTEKCSIVATSSIAGLLTGTLGSYGVTKHGVVAMMEAIRGEFQMRGKTHVNIHVLCPGFVNTNILQGSTPLTPMGRAMHAIWPRGMTPEYVASQVFEGMQAGKFYLVVDHPNPEMAGDVLNIFKRHRAIETDCTPAISGINRTMLEIVAKEEQEKAKSKL